MKSSKQRLKEDQSYSKAIQSFTKSLKKISTSKKGTFERSLFTFSKEQSGPKGTKNKKGKLITVPTTALARRRYKHRGRSVAPLHPVPQMQKTLTILCGSFQREKKCDKKCAEFTK